MATLMLFCEMRIDSFHNMFQIQPNVLYYRDYMPKVYRLFSVAFDVFYIFKKYTYFTYVAYNRFNPAFGQQYANKSCEDRRGVISTFFLRRAKFLYIFQCPRTIEKLEKSLKNSPLLEKLQCHPWHKHEGIENAMPFIIALQLGPSSPRKRGAMVRTRIHNI